MPAQAATEDGRIRGAAESRVPTPEASRASSLSRKVAPRDLHGLPVGAADGVGLGEGCERDVGRPALARVDGVEEALDRALDRGRQPVSEGELEVIPGLVVLACGAVGAGELEPDPCEVRADGEDGFVLFRGLARPAQAHVDRAQQEAPLDRLVLVGGLGLLEQREHMLEAPLLHQQPGGREGSV